MRVETVARPPLPGPAVSAQRRTTPARRSAPASLRGGDRGVPRAPPPALRARVQRRAGRARQRPGEGPGRRAGPGDVVGLGPGRPRAPASAPGSRPVHMAEGYGVMDAAVLHRRELAVSDRSTGPPSSTRLDSTVLVPPGSTAVALRAAACCSRRCAGCTRGSGAGRADRGDDMTDPITIEVIRHGLHAAAARDGRDAAADLLLADLQRGQRLLVRDLRRRAELVSHGEFLPIHLGSLALLGPASPIGRSGRGARARATAILLNDPYQRGSHLPDVTLVSPIFDGDELVASPPTAPITSTSAATSPAASTPRRARTIRRACGSRRSSSSAAGERDDAAARSRAHQLPAARPDADRPREPGSATAPRIDRRAGARSSATAPTCSRRRSTRSLDNSERRMRAAIGSWPDGDYSASDFLDNDGISEEPPRDPRRRSAIRGDERRGRLHRQLAAESRARSTACSVTRTPGVYMTFQAATDPDIVAQRGCYRPIEVIAPEGTIVNPRFPAACTGGNEVTCMIVHNAVLPGARRGRGGTARTRRSWPATRAPRTTCCIAGRRPAHRRALRVLRVPGGRLGRERGPRRAERGVRRSSGNTGTSRSRRRAPVSGPRRALRAPRDSGGAGDPPRRPRHSPRLSRARARG